MSYKAGRNEPCPCGSGIKFKRCHGKPAGIAAGMQIAPARTVASAIEQFRKGNLPQAELLCREYLDRVPEDPSALTLLGDIAVRIGAHRAARRYYSQALRRAPDSTAARQGYLHAGMVLEQAVSNVRKDGALTTCSRRISPNGPARIRAWRDYIFSIAPKTSRSAIFTAVWPT
jgi:tetratricopeptide (TPR) repeat protein